jgi:hypothetical protein
MRSICQAPNTKKALFSFIFAWQSGNFCVFRSKRCRELKSSFLVVEAYTLEKFWDKELTKRRKMVEMTGGLFQV